MPLTRQQCEHNLFGSSSEMPINQSPTCNDVVKSFFYHRNLDYRKFNLLQICEIVSEEVVQRLNIGSIPTAILFNFSSWDMNQNYEKCNQ